MSALSGSLFDAWKEQLERQLVTRYRDSVRNRGDNDPVFRIDAISRNTNDNDGFGIMGTTGRDRNATLMLYSSTTGYVQVNMNSQEFSLTESGKRYFRQMDPEIG
jgi:hypothetical protein